MFKVINKNTRTTSLTNFSHFFSVFSVDIEQGEMLAGYFSLKKAKEKI